jgi:hypothetical protein
MLVHGRYRPERKPEQLCAETITCDEGTNFFACNTVLLYSAVGRYIDCLIKVLHCLLFFYLITCWIPEQLSLYKYWLWNK